MSEPQRRALILMAYGIEILADNGAYEDAAWLSADVGLFLETSEIYTKLNKHERALTGYARAKQFKKMFSYIRKFTPDLLCCLMVGLVANHGEQV